VLRLLSNLAKTKVRTPPSKLLLSLLHTAVDALIIAKPRIVEIGRRGSPTVIFTDGACEGDLVTVGAVLIDADGVECFGVRVPFAVYSSWCKTEGQTQVIGQAELYPLLLARLTWAGRIAGRRIIWFIDNESARQAMIRAYSPVESSLLIIVDCVTFDYTYAVHSWHARVPTGCNIADAPSRLKMSKFLVDVECRVVDPVSPAGPAMLESMVGRFG
jgi:hypothetical protein